MWERIGNGSVSWDNDGCWPRRDGGGPNVAWPQLPREWPFNHHTINGSCANVVHLEFTIKNGGIYPAQYFSQNIFKKKEIATTRSGYSRGYILMATQ